MASILLTGYEPFGGSDRNPSQEVAQQLDGRQAGGLTVIGRTMPVNWVKLPGVLTELVEELQPQAVVMLGEAPGRPHISLERIGINCANGKDNEEQEREDAPLAEDGPAAHFATLPLRAMETALKEAGIPCKVSNTAGTYLCNAALYWIHQLQEEERIAQLAQAGFIHVPSMPEQVASDEARKNIPSMDVSVTVRAVETALEVIAERVG